MTIRKKIEVSIDGRNFTVVGSENEDYVRSVAKYVDKKIKELTNKNDRLCQTSSATLAALNIADELHRVSNRLNELEDEAKDPMEKYSDARVQLEEARAKIKELEELCLEYKDDLLKAKIEKDSANDGLTKYEEAMELKEKELLESQKMIKSLQDKVFDNQIELIETKKELGEVLRRLDSEKNIFAKGDA